MRGQTLFWFHQKLVIELLKHSHFLTNYLKEQILASYNYLRIGQDSEFESFDLGQASVSLEWPKILWKGKA